MPQSNKGVLLGGAVIITVGFIKAVSGGGNPSKVFAGGVGLILLASLLELAGEGASKVASGLVGVATITVLLVEAPSVYQAISKGTSNAHNPFNGTNQNQNAGSPGSGQTSKQVDPTLKNFKQRTGGFQPA